MANNQGTDRPASGKPRGSLGSIQVPTWAAAALVVGLVGVIGIVFWQLQAGGATPTGAASPQTQFASEAAPGAPEVEVLPQAVRSFGGGEVKNPFATEELGPIRVSGVVINSNGKGTAILEAQGVSYIVSTGETLPESTWTVTRIGSSSVTFSNKGSEKTIYMDGQNSGAEVG
jgi:type II secretory pathway component PulC